MESRYDDRRSKVKARYAVMSKINIRIDFPIFNQKNKIIYFDSASTTQKPIQVINKITDYYKNYNANVHRGLYGIAEQATLEYENVRENIAKFINCRSDEIVFTKGTTESINLIANCLGDTFLSKKDEIIITEMEHHSNIVPWQLLSKKKNIKLKYIPISNKGKLKLEKIDSLITDKTKVISITHMSNLLGTINDIKKIIATAKKHNILTIIDAAQSISHENISIKELGCDFLVFSGHKIFGPTGVGVLFGRKKILKKIPPFLGGGHMIKEVSMDSSSWADIPFKFEAGTPNIAQVIGLGESIKYFNKIYNKNSLEYLKSLKKYLFENLSKIPNIKFYSTTDPSINSGPIIAFNIGNIHSFDIAKLLGSKGICIRSGHHCAQPILKKYNVHSINRISLYYYNTVEEIDFFYKTLLKVIKILT